MALYFQRAGCFKTNLSSVFLISPTVSDLPKVNNVSCFLPSFQRFFMIPNQSHDHKIFQLLGHDSCHGVFACSQSARFLACWSEHNSSTEENLSFLQKLYIFKIVK